MIRNSFCKVGSAVALLTTLVSVDARAADWQLSDLGFAMGSSVGQINNHGDIVGNIGYFGTYDTFLYSNGSVANIGHLETDPFMDPYSNGIRLNNLGKAVGTSSYADGSAGFVYQNGSLSKVGTIMTRAVDVNDAGLVVGTNGGQSYLLNNGVETDLGSLGGATIATGINNASQVVGFARLADSSQVLFTYSNGQLTSLGDAGFNFAAPTEINDHGLIIGTGYRPGDATFEQVSFLYDHGVVTDLSAKGGLADFTVRGMNNKGQVVGNTLDGTAYLYSDGKFINLSQYGIQNVGDINDEGQIDGYSIVSGNVAILQAGALPVPEPASYVLLLLGMGTLGLLRRKS